MKKKISRRLVLRSCIISSFRILVSDFLGLLLAVGIRVSITCILPYIIIEIPQWISCCVFGNPCKNRTFGSVGERRREFYLFGDFFWNCHFLLDPVLFTFSIQIIQCESLCISWTFLLAKLNRIEPNTTENIFVDLNLFGLEFFHGKRMLKKIAKIKHFHDSWVMGPFNVILWFTNRKIFILNMHLICFDTYDLRIGNTKNDGESKEGKQYFKL